jgi:predicted DNA-binding transcriptional regulator YafY
MNGQPTAPPRNRALIRTWQIVRRLEAPRHDATLRQLAAETEFGTRTIRRDLAAIAAAGFPLVTDTEEPGGTSLAH